jgi:hypothetical protein
MPVGLRAPGLAVFAGQHPPPSLRSSVRPARVERVAALPKAQRHARRSQSRCAGGDVVGCALAARSDPGT